MDTGKGCMLVVRFASHDEKGFHFVIPANAGIHGAVWIPAPRLRGDRLRGDDTGDDQ